MGRKHILKPYKVIDAQAMTGDITGTATSIEQMDVVSYSFSWSGGAGDVDESLKVEFSHDKDAASPVWFDAAPSETFALQGDSGQGVVEVLNPGFKFARTRFVRNTSTAGTLDAWISGTTRGA